MKHLYFLILCFPSCLLGQDVWIHNLEMNNGRSIPVILTEEKIFLNDGWNDFSIEGSELLDVKFDGGLYGKIMDSQKNEKDLEFSTVKDLVFNAVDPSNQEKLIFRWSEIFSIKRDSTPLLAKNVVNKRALSDWHSRAKRKMGLLFSEQSEMVVQTASQPTFEVDNFIENEKRRADLLSSKLEAALQSLTHKEKQIKAYEESIIHYKQELQQAEFRRLQALSLKDDEHAETSQAFLAQIQALSAKLKSKESELTGLQQFSKTQLKELRIEQEAVQNEKQSLAKELERLSENFEAALKCARQEKNVLESSLAARGNVSLDLENEISALKKQVKGMATALADLRTAQEVGEIENLVLSKELENQVQVNLESSIQIETLQAMVVEKKDELLALSNKQQKESKVFELKIEEIQKEIAFHLADVATERQINEELMKKLAISSESLTKTMQALERSQDQAAQWSSENKELKNAYAGLRGELHKEKEQRIVQKEVIDRLTASIKAQKAVLTKIEQSHINLVSDLESARSVNVDISLDHVKQAKTHHMVAEGENLNNISMKHYHTPHRWGDIYEANREIISDSNQLKLGSVLIIPE